MLRLLMAERVWLSVFDLIILGPLPVCWSAPWKSPQGVGSQAGTHAGYNTNGADVSKTLLRAALEFA